MVQEAASDIVAPDQCSTFFHFSSIKIESKKYKTSIFKFCRRFFSSVPHCEILSMDSDGNFSKKKGGLDAFGGKTDLIPGADGISILTVSHPGLDGTDKRCLFVYQDVYFTEGQVESLPIMKLEIKISQTGTHTNKTTKTKFSKSFQI